MLTCRREQLRWTRSVAPSMSHGGGSLSKTWAGPSQGIPIGPARQWDASWAFQRPGLMFLGSLVPGTVRAGCPVHVPGQKVDAILAGLWLQGTSLHLSLPTEIVASVLHKGSFPAAFRKCLLSWLPEEMDTCGVCTSEELT